MAKKICSVDGCGGKVIARGLCFPHYQRRRRNGKLGVNPIRHVGLGDTWLEAHKGWVDAKECLTWPFGKKGGRGPSRKMAILAHGEPPTPHHLAAHKCGKGHEGCVNPNHLYWATYAQNTADRDAHGTMLRGEDVPGSKLTTPDVLSIKRALRTRKWGQNKMLAQQYGVTQATICDIKKGRRWRHVN